MATENKISILVSAVDEASKILKKVSGSVDSFAERNRATFEGMRNYGAVAFGAVSLGMTGAISSASDLSESINALNVVFEDSSEELLKF